jgi:solute:Na+ symporter, SSS family
MALDLIVVLIYLAAMVGVGWIGMRRARTTEDYLVAGRRLGPGFYMGTLSAVVLGGASTIGTAALGYEFGISGMWLVFMLGLGIIVLSALLAGRLTRLGVYTVSQMLELRYQASARLITGVIMSAYALMIAVTSTIAIGTVVDVLFGIPRVPAILVGGGVVVLYSVIGGMWSLTLTDIVQFLIMTVGIFLIMLPLAIGHAGGLEGMQAALPASYFDFGAIGFDRIFTYFLIYFFGILIGQDIWQRVFTARSDSVARNAGIVAGVYCLLYGLAVALIGAAGKVFLPELESTDSAFAAITQEALPAGVRGLVLAAALAAIMSTASAGLLASSTLLLEDIYERFFAHEAGEHLAANRMATLAVGVVVLILACLVNDVIAALTVAYNLLVGGLLVPIIGALVWRRATGAGALAAIAVGGTVVVIFMITDGLLADTPIYFGLLASLVAFVVVSLVTEPTSEQQLAEWEERLEGRAAAGTSVPSRAFH